MVKSCKIYYIHLSNIREPFKSDEWRTKPWHTVGTDIFEFHGIHYLLVVDYHSRFSEIVKQKSTSIIDIIKVLMQIFVTEFRKT